MEAPNDDLVLHTHYKSSCSGRLRIALNIKGIQAKYTYVDLGKGEQRGSNYIELNPSGTVPVLTHLSHDRPVVAITQSIAALEYLEEVFGDKDPLLPSNSVARAQVRILVDVIAVDTQPLTNRSLVRRVTDLDGNGGEWHKQFLARGLHTYEKLVSKTVGRYSVGDRPTLADVCLVPCMWNAEHYGVDLDALPTVKRIYKAMMELEAVEAAHWRKQADCPTDGVWL